MIVIKNETFFEIKNRYAYDYPLIIQEIPYIYIYILFFRRGYIFTILVLLVKGVIFKYGNKSSHNNNNNNKLPKIHKFNLNYSQENPSQTLRKDVSTISGNWTALKN